MYQPDISGQNAIDYAFQRDSIFCIKSFVDSILKLSDDGESQFRNCFDQALLLMISRGIDVIELVNSQLLYPSIWTTQTLFSTNENAIAMPYNKDVGDLEFEDPDGIFCSHKKTKEGDEEAHCDDHDFEKHEKFEMEYNYIYMEKIQGKNKIDISKCLSECEDIPLFQQELIQHIIDYKWETYTKNSFTLQFLVYFVFLIFYYLDLEQIESDKGY